MYVEVCIYCICDDFQVYISNLEPQSPGFSLQPIQRECLLDTSKTELLTSPRPQIAPPVTFFISVIVNSLLEVLRKKNLEGHPFLLYFFHTPYPIHHKSYWFQVGYEILDRILKQKMDIRKIHKIWINYGVWLIKYQHCFINYDSINVSFQK